MKNDRRLLLRMIDKKMTCARLAERLKCRGHNVEARDVYNIATRVRKVDRKMQEDIADILGCLRKDIF